MPSNCCSSIVHVALSSSCVAAELMLHSIGLLLLLLHALMTMLLFLLMMMMMTDTTSDAHQVDRWRQIRQHGRLDVADYWTARRHTDVLSRLLRAKYTDLMPILADGATSIYVIQCLDILPASRSVCCWAQI